MINEKVIVESVEVNSILERMSLQIVETSPDLNNLAIVGIKRRGVNIANRLTNHMNNFNKKGFLYGELDITLYRDDLTEINSIPDVKKSTIDFDVNNKIVVLVDDVLYTGRTIRSAIEAILDFGRPRKILLAVLIDRGHRELPIEANFVGKHIQTTSNEVIHVKVKEIDGIDDCVAIATIEK